MKNAEIIFLNFLSSTLNDRSSEKRKVTGPDENYGRLELEPDMPSEIIEEKKKKTFISELELSKKRAEELERSTISQIVHRYQ